MVTYKYRALGKTIELQPDQDLVAVQFKEPARHSVRVSAAARAGFDRFSDRTEILDEKYTILPVSAAPVSRGPRVAAAMRSLDAAPEVERTAPVFKIGDRHVVATDRVLVGFKRGTTKEHRALIKKTGGAVLREGDGEESEYVIQLAPADDPFVVCQTLLKNKSVEYAEPDFVTIGRHVAKRPRGQAPSAGMRVMGAGADPLIPKQYAMRITQSVDAWHLQGGDREVRIAVLDEGVDSRHEDLKDSVVGAYDAIDNDEFQEPNRWDSHGTCCAGLAAAVPNNATGLRGVAGGCSLLAVRIAYADHDGGDWVTTNEKIRRAIDWSWRNQAWVLSNSWGGGAPSTAIANAFERARKRGRSGKGCVIVIAAGNESGEVSFPATLKNIIAVSASNEYDEFKTKTSMDGESWWGSNYGPEVTIAAPGVHNYTTDITGEGDPDLTNYTSSFNGTSSATPIVAGAAALVLSANSSLTEKQVREIVSATADKVGAFPYTHGRNDQFGSGRLNVLKAVRAATGQPVGEPHASRANVAVLGGGSQPSPRSGIVAKDILDPYHPRWAVVPKNAAQSGPIRHICYVGPDGENQKTAGARGTGFLASPRIVVTAAHVVADVAAHQGRPIKTSVLNVVLGFDWYTAKAKVFRSKFPPQIHPNWDGTRGSAFDIAAFAIDPPGGGALTPFVAPAPSQLNQRAVYVAGFTPFLDPAQFIYSTGRLQSPSTGLIWHSADTEDGESGAPLIVEMSAGDFRAVGLHTFGRGLGGQFNFNGGLYFTGAFHDWFTKINKTTNAIA